MTKWVRNFLLLLAIASCGHVSAQQAVRDGGVLELTPAELERYEFEEKDTNALVSDLTVGQQYVLSTQRREISDLASRRLGIFKLKGNKSDLVPLQKIIDERYIGTNQTREWQGVGIVFGDILANEFGMHWVSYEDELGLSKALRWRDTENYIFPVTMFSKRIQFNEKIDVASVFDTIAQNVTAFKDYEQNRTRFE